MSRKTREAVLVALLLGLGSILRFADLSVGLWIDELISSWVVAEGPRVMLERSWMANLSPVYFAIASISMEVVGTTEFGIRLPSVLAGIMLLPLIYTIVRSATREPLAALAVLVLAAVDPQLVDVSRWARPISLLLLMSTLNMYCFYSVVVKKSGSGWSHTMLVSSAVLAFYLHYTWALFLVCQAGLAALWWWAGEVEARTVRRLLLDALFILILFVPAAPHLIRLGLESGTLGPTSAGYIGSVLTQHNLDRYLLIPLLASLVVHIVWKRRLAGWWAGGERRHLAASTMWFGMAYALPMFLVWSLAKVGIVQLTPYTRFCAPVGLVFVGMTIASLRGVWSKIALLAVATLMIVSAEDSFARRHLESGSTAHPWQEWREALGKIGEEGRDGDVVLVDAGLYEGQWLRAESPDLQISYLLSPVLGMYRLDRTPLALYAISEAYVPIEVVERERPDRLWIVAPIGHRDLIDVVARQLALAGQEFGAPEKRSYRGVVVALFHRIDAERND